MRMINVLFLLACFAAIGSVHGQEVRTKVLPTSAWQVLEDARGIRVGGPIDARPSIQVIFDANCPYCARLHESLLRDHPEIAVRWVPIAYFRTDSAVLAAAILNSPDPQASLRRNFSEYDYKSHHGGYPVPERHASVPFGKAQTELEKFWKTWGGYTPMYIFRDKQGQIRMTGGAAGYIVEQVIKMSAPATSIRNPTPLHD